MSNTMHRRTLLELIPHYNESIQNKAFLSFLFACTISFLSREGNLLHLQPYYPAFRSSSIVVYFTVNSSIANYSLSCLVARKFRKPTFRILYNRLFHCAFIHFCHRLCLQYPLHPWTAALMEHTRIIHSTLQ